MAHLAARPCRRLAVEVQPRRRIGDEANDWLRYLADPAARLHLYGKESARPGRKMGHVTFLAR